MIDTADTWTSRMLFMLELYEVCFKNNNMCVCACVCLCVLDQPRLMHQWLPGLTRRRLRHSLPHTHSPHPHTYAHARTCTLIAQTPLCIEHTHTHTNAVLRTPQPPGGKSRDHRHRGEAFGGHDGGAHGHLPLGETDTSLPLLRRPVHQGAGRGLLGLA